jgi:hypothetical protein
VVAVQNTLSSRYLTWPWSHGIRSALVDRSEWNRIATHDAERIASVAPSCAVRLRSNGSPLILLDVIRWDSAQSGTSGPPYGECGANFHAGRVAVAHARLAAMAGSPAGRHAAEHFTGRLTSLAVCLLSQGKDGRNSSATIAGISRQALTGSGGTSLMFEPASRLIIAGRWHSVHHHLVVAMNSQFR